MPSNWLHIDAKFPSFTGKESMNEKIGSIENYLYLLVEQLRYTLFNLDLSNMNQTAVSRFENSITAPIDARIKSAEGDIAKLALTADALELQISDAEDDILQLGLTAEELKLQISNAENDILQMQTTAEGMKLQISDAESDILRLNATAEELELQISDAEDDILQLGLTADALELQISNAEDDILQLGLTADEMKLSINNLDGEFNEISATIDGLTITNSEGTTKIKGSSIDTGTIEAQSIRADQVMLTDAITFTELNDDVVSYMSSSYSLAYSANEIACNANDLIQGWVYPGSTYIDGSMLMTGTVMASHLKGGTISLINGTGTTSGSITLSDASSGAYAIDIQSNAALRIYSNAGDMWIEADGTTSSYLWIRGTSAAPTITCHATFRPSEEGIGTFTLGDAYHKWGSVYSVDGVIQTSDRNAKHDIIDIPESYVDLFMGLRPRLYKYDNGTSGRYHIGYVAQEVEQAMLEAGISSENFAALVIDVDADGNEIYMLRYEEFMALHTMMIQKLVGGKE